MINLRKSCEYKLIPLFDKSYNIMILPQSGVKLDKIIKY